MNQGRTIAVLACLTCSCLGRAEPPAPAAMTPMPAMSLPAGVEIEFTSDGADIGARVADLIEKEDREVLISQYALTDIRVLQAVSRAVQRGVVVAALLDRSPAIRNYETPRYLREQGVPVIAANRGTDGQGWHNQRYVILGRQTVILTSCDLTNSARHNTENVIILREPSIASRYYNCWLKEAEHGTKVP